MSIKALSIKLALIIPAVLAVITIYILLQESDAATKVVANIPTFSNDSTIVDLLEKDYEELTYTSEGGSSWYGKKFHNRKTASGEKYNMNALTAAHKSLPFGSIAIIENLENNSKMMVRINDRGPYHGKRIIDFSYASAKNLDNFENNKVKINSVQFNKLKLMPNLDYFLAHSLDKPFKCVPSYQVSLMDSTSDFELAYKLYQIKQSSNQGVYLMTKINSELVNSKRMDVEKYYIGVVKRNMLQLNNILAEKF